MGARGPAAQPSALQAARGNPGKRPLNKQEPTPERGIPPKPEWLTGPGSALWDRLTPHLDQAGLVTQVDAVALETLCFVYGEWCGCAKDVRRKGRFCQGAFGRQQRLEFSNSIKLIKQLLPLLDRFGMNPSARSRMTAAPEGEEEDLFEKFTGLHRVKTPAR